MAETPDESNDIEVLLSRYNRALQANERLVARTGYGGDNYNATLDARSAIVSAFQSLRTSLEAAERELAGVRFRATQQGEALRNQGPFTITTSSPPPEPGA